MVKELQKAGFTDKQAEVVMKKIKRARRQDLVLMASALVLLIGAVFLVLTIFTNNINEAAIQNCEDTNHTTAAVVRTLDRGIQITEQEIKETRRTDYSSLFPNIPPAQLEALIDQQVAQLREQNENRRHDREKLVLVDCKAQFP